MGLSFLAIVALQPYLGEPLFAPVTARGPSVRNRRVAERELEVVAQCQIESHLGMRLGAKASRTASSRS